MCIHVVTTALSDSSTMSTRLLRGKAREAKVRPWKLGWEKQPAAFTTQRLEEVNPGLLSKHAPDGACGVILCLLHIAGILVLLQLKAGVVRTLGFWHGSRLRCRSRHSSLHLLLLLLCAVKGLSGSLLAAAAPLLAAACSRAFGVPLVGGSSSPDATGRQPDLLLPPTFHDLGAAAALGGGPKKSASQDSLCESQVLFVMQFYSRLLNV